MKCNIAVHGLQTFSGAETNRGVHVAPSYYTEPAKPVEE